MKSGPRDIGSFLPPALARRLSAYLDEESRLLAAWQLAVRPPLADHARPGNYSRGRLEVRVNSPAWASRLRQHQGELVRLMQAMPGLEGLRELLIRVVPKGQDRVPAAPASVPAARLAPGAAPLLDSLAADVTDPQLRAALQRLGATARASSK